MDNGVRTFIEDYTKAQADLWKEKEQIKEKYEAFSKQWQCDADVFFVRPSGNPMTNEIAVSNLNIEL